MKIQLSKKDVLFSYLGTVVSLLSNIVLIPVIVFFLDKDKIGLWYLFASIGTFATLFDCGFNVTFSRNITYCWNGAEELKKSGAIFISENKNVNYYLFNTVLNACRRIYLYISLIALFFLLVIGTFYIVWISRNLNGYSHIVAWIIYSTAVCSNLYFGYFSSFLRGIGAISHINIDTIVSRLVQLTCTIIFLALGMDLIGACLAYLLYGLVFRILARYSFFSYKNIGKKLGSIEKSKKLEENKIIKIIWSNAWKEGVIALSHFGCTQITVIICSIFLSLSETGIYSLSVQLAMAVAMISATLYGAYHPQLQSAYITDQKDETKRIMSIVVLSNIILFFIGTVGILTVGLPILRLLKPEINLQVGVQAGLCFYYLLLNIRNCYTSYFSCTNRLIYYKAFIVSSMTCTILSCLSLAYSDLGLYGLIYSQIISQILFNVWYWPVKSHNEMNLGFSEMVYLFKNECKKIL